MDKTTQIPTEMRDFAEKSVDQARKAFDGFIGAAKKSVTTFEGSASTVHATASDMTHRTLGYAEQNVTAAFEHARNLVRAKDLQEAMQLQAEFVREQFAAMQTQMKEFGSLTQSAVQKAGADAEAAAKEASDTARQAADAAADMPKSARK